MEPYRREFLGKGQNISMDKVIKLGRQHEATFGAQQIEYTPNEELTFTLSKPTPDTHARIVDRNTSSAAVQHPTPSAIIVATRDIGVNTATNESAKKRSIRKEVTKTKDDVSLVNHKRTISTLTTVKRLPFGLNISQDIF